MGLLDAILPKRYKNSRTLYEEDLDAWRQKTEEYLNTVNLNLQQLGIDVFGSDYEFNNDGHSTEPVTLEQYIYNIIDGTQPIDGTSSDTFIINSDGNASTLTTASMTAPRTHTLPDIAGTFMMLEGTQTASGVKTFNTMKVKGAGAGIATIQNANTADNRTLTIPDPGADSTLMALAGSQSVTGSKTYSAAALKVGGAGAGVASLQYASSANSRTHTIPDGGSDLTFAMVGLGDWDTFWSDPAHNHSSAAEGGNIPYTSITGTPDLSHVTYDNVAESITSVWDFKSGAHLDQVSILNNDIYESETNDDNGRIYINAVGYLGGTTKYRDLLIGDGKGNWAFSIDGATATVSVGDPSPDLESNFYTGVSNTLANGTEPLGNIVELDRQVTPNSLCKAWVGFDTTSLSQPTNLKTYNVSSVELLDGANPTYPNSFKITWTKPFLDNPLVFVTPKGNIGSGIDMASVLYSGTTYCIVYIQSTGAAPQTASISCSVCAFGVLA